MQLTASQLKAARALLGWTQDDLAAKMKVSSQTVRAWEKDDDEPLRIHDARMARLLRVLLSAGIEYSEKRDHIFISIRKRK